MKCLPSDYDTGRRGVDRPMSDNIAQQQAFNRWLVAYGANSPEIARLDTTGSDPIQTAAAVKEWIDFHGRS